MKTESGRVINLRCGIAIPIVLLFCLCVMVMASSLFYFRKESKQQNVNTFHFLQVNFLAQSAAQHLLLKLSAFPQDAYDSGVLSLGYCPFRGIPASTAAMPAPGNKDNGGLLTFASDCTATSPAWLVPGITASDWKYSISDFEIISAYTDAVKRQTVLTAQLTAIGEGKMARGNMGIRKEKLVKTVQLTGQN